MKCGDNNEDTGGQTGSESSDACGKLPPHLFCSWGKVIFQSYLSACQYHVTW